jgi:FkbM family methyltransferase
MSKWTYYGKSIPTLLGGVQNWSALVRLPFHTPAAEPIRVDLRNGSRFLVRSLMDLWIVKETCLDRIYEEAPFPLNAGSIVMDIGAGLGDFTVYAARRYPGCRIVAFEPFAESFRLLEQNLALNNVTGVQALPKAVGARSGGLSLQTATGVAVQHSTAAADAGATSIQVDSLSLNDAFRQLDLSRCDLLKVDCEGGEYDIFFHAAPATMEMIQRVAMEYHDEVTKHSHAELVDFFSRQGFSVRTKPNPVHTSIGMLYATR